MKRARAALAAVALAGCSVHPLVPKQAVSSAPPVKVVKPILGADLYSSGRFTPAIVASDGHRDLAYMRHVLGAQSVGIVWNLYTPSAASEAVGRTRISLTPREVAALTRQAQALGMSVEYRPLIRVGPAWKWEGSIDPPDQRAWFASLFRAELPYLRTARRLHVATFVVGTELRQLAASPQWPQFLAKVRSVYHGTVTYASWQGDYTRQPAVLPPTSVLGVDPYPHLQLPAAATPAQVAAAWDRYLGQVPQAILARTVMQEVGIRGTAGAYRHPELWGVRGRPDQQVQARWFTAACQAVARYHMRGIYFYEVNLTDNPAHPSSFPAFFEGNLGARAIHGCLRIFEGRPVP